MRFILFALWIVGVAHFSAEGRQPGATLSEVSSINSLKTEAPLTLDPKLRRALLRVLSKLEMEDPYSPGEGGTGEVSDEELHKLFGRPAEDAVSVETPDASKPPASNQDFNFIPPTELEEQQSIQRNQELNYIPTTSASDATSPTTNDTTSTAESTGVAEPTPSQATNPTPDKEALFFQNPTPIDIPDEEGPKSEVEFINETTTVTEDKSQAQVTTLNPETEDTPKNETPQAIPIPNFINTPNYNVEFLPSALIAAFTLQQDNLGVPKRVIPLQDHLNSPQLAYQKQKELYEKETALQAQLRYLQLERLRVQSAFQPKTANTVNSLQFQATTYSPERLVLSPSSFNPERVRVQNQRRPQPPQQQQQQQQQPAPQNLVFQRSQELQELQQQEFLRQKERLDQARLQRFQEQRPAPFAPSINSQNDITPNLSGPPRKPLQNIEFLKSVDVRPSLSLTPSRHAFIAPSRYQLQAQYVPGFELNRVNRNEPSQFVGNFENFNQNFRPLSVDSQLQNLLVQSGVSTTFLPTEAKDDLNIVSKVLSYNHFPGERENRAKEPSRLIEPPVLKK